MTTATDTETKVDTSAAESLLSSAATETKSVDESLLNANESSKVDDKAPVDEKKVDDGKQPEVKKDEAPPEKYEFKDVPEGFDAAAYEKWAKDNGLSPKAAQAAITRELEAVNGFEKYLNDKYENLTKKEWVAQIKNDPELGGPKFDESKAQAGRAWDTVPAALRKAVADANLTNNPILFKLAHHFGSRLKEDTMVRGNQATEPMSRTKMFYGTSK